MANDPFQFVAGAERTDEYANTTDHRDCECKCRELRSRPQHDADSSSLTDARADQCARTSVDIARQVVKSPGPAFENQRTPRPEPLDTIGKAVADRQVLIRERQPDRTAGMNVEHHPPAPHRDHLPTGSPVLS